MNINDLSYSELQKHIGEASMLLENKRRDALQALVKEIEELISHHNFPKEDVIEALGGRSKGQGTRSSKPVSPMYKSPDDENLTWSGRGRTPQWVLNFVGVDKLDKADPSHAEKLEELLIHQAN